MFQSHWGRLSGSEQVYDTLCTCVKALGAISTSVGELGDLALRRDIDPSTLRP
jgi:hypothetical protein